MRVVKLVGGRRAFVAMGWSPQDVSDEQHMAYRRGGATDKAIPLTTSKVRRGSDAGPSRGQVFAGAGGPTFPSPNGVSPGVCRALVGHKSLEHGDLAALVVTLQRQVALANLPQSRCVPCSMLETVLWLIAGRWQYVPWTE